MHTHIFWKGNVQCGWRGKASLRLRWLATMQMQNVGFYYSQFFCLTRMQSAKSHCNWMMGMHIFFTFSILLHSAFGQIWLTREEVDKRRVLNGKANLETFRNFAKANYQSVTGCCCWGCLLLDKADCFPGNIRWGKGVFAKIFA